MSDTATDQRSKALPGGVVTFLLTDVESSTPMWQAEPEAMAAAIERQYSILDETIKAHRGIRPEEQGEGDSVVAVFHRASDAIAAARDAQLALDAEVWPTATPIRVRMGIHTGESRRRNEDNYIGLTIVRAARVRNLASGGQILVTTAARDVALDRLPADIDLVDLGDHGLKGLTRPERLFQLTHDRLRVDFPGLDSLNATPHNLPINLSTFVGRDDELRAVGDFLTRGRLVTVLGTGGVGKTRLALEYAANAAGDFGDGVWWVDLAAVTDASDTAAALVAAVGTSSTNPRRHAESVAARLDNGHALLILDNCEHLDDEPARIVVLLLRSCPNLRILATSRRPLEVSGEMTWRIPAMATPTGDRSSISVEDLAEVDSVILFLHRAQVARPTFALDDHNAADVAEICQRLAGIPLAIELASARTKSMLPSQILAGLDDAMRMLSHGPRMLSSRHRTIKASIQWSRELLGDSERHLLDRLSVFRGSFNLVGAEVVCSGDGLDQTAVLDSIDELIDHSLVRALDDETDRRFTLLETVRQFGHEKLLEAEAVDHWQAKAADYFAEIAADFGPRCETADQFDALDCLDVEHKNLLAALAWLQRQRSSDQFTDMVLALGGYWDVGGDKLEGETWATRALDVVAESDLVSQSRLFALRAECRHSIGKYLLALEDGRSALDLGREAGDPLGAGRGSSTIASILSHVDLDAWQDQWNTTVELLEEAGDQYGLAGTQTWGAVPFLRRGQIKEGLVALKRAMPYVMASGSPLLLASQQSWQAYAQIMVGDPASAETLALEAQSSGAMRSHARAKGIQTLLHQARAGLGHERLSWRELLTDLERSRRRGEHFAVDHDVIVTASATVRPNPFAAIEMVDQWLTDRSALETTQHPEAKLIGAHGALALGNLDETHRRATSTLESATRVRHVVIAGRAKTTLAAVDLERGNTVSAEALVREAIVTHVEHGNQPPLKESVAVLASIAATCGDYVEAARLFGAIGTHGRIAAFARLLTKAERLLTEQLAASELAAASAAGAKLTDEELIAFIDRSRGSRGRPSLGWDSLSPTEQAVAALVREGLTNSQIAESLLMGAETVKTHMSHIFRKLDISKRTQLATLVVEREARG